MKKRLFIYSLHVFGILAISIFGYFRLDATAHQAAVYLQNSTTKLLNEVKTFNHDVLTKTINDNDCPEFLKVSDDFIYKHSYLRSITLSDTAFITCSTVTRDKRVLIKRWAPSEQSTRLFYTYRTPFKDRPLTMQHDVLLLRMPISKYIDTTFAFHTEVFKQAISYNAKFNLSLHFENIIFSPTGVIFATDAPKPDFVLHTHLFDISYRISFSNIISYIISNYGLLIIMWILVISLTCTPLYNTYRNYNLTFFYIRKGLIPPIQFIDIAENNGQISDITSQLVEKCIDILKHHRFPETFYLSLNVCPIQFENDQFYNDCQRMQQKLAPLNVQLVIELTERKEFTDNARYITYIERLKDNYIQVALDNFGTGHCSLKYVHQVEIDHIKIDKSYVETIDSSSNTNVLDNIIDLAKRTHISLVAEGIETQAQLDYLISKDVEYFQGFLLERAIPLTDFVKKYL